MKLEETKKKNIFIFWGNLKNEGNQKHKVGYMNESNFLILKSDNKNDQ